MRIVFMGTPDIAADSLRALLAAGHEIAGVYTREDKPVGRRQVLTPPPVKMLALEKGLPVLQPRTLREEGAAAALAALRPDIVVVVAYGRILPPDVLAVPRLGCVNLHVSLLPKYRGAAPVQWAVINGEAETGVTIMQLDAGLDTGPVLSQETVTIAPDETAGELFEKVSAQGAALLCRTLADIEAGRVLPCPQQGQASYAPPLEKGMAQVDFTRPAPQIHNLVRGCNPWPLAWFIHDGKRIKLLESQLLGDAPAAAPGTVLGTSPLVVACGEGALVLGRVVPEGARPMAGAEWAAGRRFTPGSLLCGK